MKSKLSQGESCTGSPQIHLGVQSYSWTGLQLQGKSCTFPFPQPIRPHFCKLKIFLNFPLFFLLFKSFLSSFSLLPSLSSSVTSPTNLQFVLLKKHYIFYFALSVFYCPFYSYFLPIRGLLHPFHKPLLDSHLPSSFNSVPLLTFLLLSASLAEWAVCDCWLSGVWHKEVLPTLSEQLNTSGVLPSDSGRSSASWETCCVCAPKLVFSMCVDVQLYVAFETHFTRCNT